MSKGITKSELANRIQEFAQNMKAGYEHLQKACEIYALTVRQAPDLAIEFHNRFEFISTGTWDKMRLVGERVIDVALLTLTDRQANALARLPLEKQQALVNQAIPVVKMRQGTQKITQIKKTIKDMTDYEFERAIDEDSAKPRTLDEQIQIINEKKDNKKARL